MSAHINQQNASVCSVCPARDMRCFHFPFSIFHYYDSYTFLICKLLQMRLNSLQLIHTGFVLMRCELPSVINAHMLMRLYGKFIIVRGVFTHHE